MKNKKAFEIVRNVFAVLGVVLLIYEVVIEILTYKRFKALNGDCCDCDCDDDDDDDDDYDSRIIDDDIFQTGPYYNK